MLTFLSRQLTNDNVKTLPDDFSSLKNVRRCKKVMGEEEEDWEEEDWDEEDWEDEEGNSPVL